MSSQEPPRAEAAKTHVKQRHCPGCKTPLSRFQLTAIALPIEQNTVPRLQEVNRAVGWSIRSVGDMSLAELQFLAFNAVCSNCSLISTWDFGVEELDEVIERGPESGVHLKWNYNPAVLRHVNSLLPDHLKSIVSQLLPPTENKKEE